MISDKYVHEEKRGKRILTILIQNLTFPMILVMDEAENYFKGYFFCLFTLSPILVFS